MYSNLVTGNHNWLKTNTQAYKIYYRMVLEFNTPTGDADQDESLRVNIYTTKPILPSQ